MTRYRDVTWTDTSRPTVEGAGVHLRRAFGFGDTTRTDPFLLLDDFRNDDPDRYLAGFPWHPHRGIETVTYMLEGTVEHGDSLGNRGSIGPGDVQWMTAGGGIIHQEMPKGDAAGRMGGFQLWANLPAASKLMPPRYRDVTAASIPVVSRPDGVVVRVICGEVDGQRGPIGDVVIAPEVLDVAVPAGQTFDHPAPVGHTVLAYVFEGAGRLGRPETPGALLGSGTVAGLTDGDQVRAQAGPDGMRFLLITGRPLREPVAWRGPIVMNTQAELDQAFAEMRDGTFIRTSES
jgi:hypothetical protein